MDAKKKKMEPCQKSDIPENLYLLKNFGNISDFGRLLQSVSCDTTRFHLRRFNKTLRENLKCFKTTFAKPCRMSVSYIRKALLKVVPLQMFGSMHNFTKFMKIIAKLCTASRHETITIEELTNSWRYADVKWLPKSDDKLTILPNVLIWLVDWITNNILKTLFCIQIDTKNNSIVYTPKQFYQSLYDKAISEMEQNKQLLPYDENLKDTKLIPCEENSEQPIRMSRLVIVPKDNARKYRPLVVTDLLKDKKDIVKKIRLNEPGFERKLFKAWNTFIFRNKGKKFYGLKMDLKDAFSNANMDVIHSLLKKYVHKPEAISEALCKQPILCRKSKIYVWNRGLMQGMVASTALCDMDRSDFDRKNLSFLLTSKESFFHRTVDDYFYCSTNLNNVNRFGSVLSQNCKINENKTERGPIITYMGRLFNVETGEVEIKIDNIETYRNKSKLYYTQFEEIDPSRFLFNICAFKCNAFNFNKLLLNLTYNSHEVLLMNYYKAMITVAFKVDCAVNIRWQKAPDILAEFVDGITKYYARRTRALILRTKLLNKKFGISRKLLRVIGCQAFVVVLKKRSLLYKTLITQLENYVKRYKSQPYNYLGEIRQLKLPNEFKDVRLKRVLQKYS